MPEKQLSKLKITPNDENTYIICDNEARTTAESAQSIANSKLKTASLLSYDEGIKTLTISILTTTD